MKTYTSFKDLDKDLRIKRLEADIYKQKAKIDITFIKDSLSFSNLTAELISQLSRKYILKKIGATLLKKIKV
ncbi:hypothetical protein SAMN05444278_103145 [Psychroflexus salarius]|uniref:Uncharacterized protein n=1 Tax=Psychroflexus salarius TaxID=1155689 RepID=A0A1M4UXM0_9FLAO|nr:DUF6327 family protein [Psychroflexus salarius]SHE61383.1 hypothetical protein SAMN05444278_103145 [Psychroflexus salarius]